jgi:cytochrome c
MMKKIFLVSMVLGAQVAHSAPSLSADESAAALALAKASGCLTCHAIDEKIVGPAYSKVAAKYSADNDAAASLAQSIRNGSQGKWGRIPMPSHGSMKQEDIDFLAKWVLTLGK